MRSVADMKQRRAYEVTVDYDESANVYTARCLTEPVEAVGDSESKALEALAAKLVDLTAEHVRKQYPEYEKVG